MIYSDSDSISHNFIFPNIKFNASLEIIFNNIEEMNISDINTMTKLSHFIINNKDKLNNELRSNLRAVKLNLKLNIREIKSDTTGIIAFFRYLFRPNLKAEKKRQLEYMETLEKFIESLLKTEKSKETSSVASIQTEIETQTDEAQVIEKKEIETQTDEAQVIEKKEIETREIETQADEAQVIEKKKIETREIETQTDEVQLVQTTATDIDTAEREAPQAKEDSQDFVAIEVSTSSTPIIENADIPKPPPPPPLPKKTDAPENPSPIPPPPPPLLNKPGFAPPPPPLSKAGGFPQKAQVPVPAKPSPEELYIQREQKKLDTKLQERANPEKFYVTTPPKDEQQLQKKKTELESDIRAFSNMLSHKEVIGAAKGVLENILKRRKDDLDQVNQNLKGSSIPVKSGSLEFKEKIKNYTNDELKILIGIIFDGKVPTETHTNYSNYDNNRDLLDDIFKEWNKISEGKSAQAFFLHADEWKRYLGANIFGIIDTLRKRQLVKTHINYLEEPTYKIPPYQPPKNLGKGNAVKKAVSEPVLKLPQQSSGSIFDEIKSTNKLKKASERILPGKKEKEEPLSLHEQLKQGIQKGVKLKQGKNSESS